MTTEKMVMTTTMVVFGMSIISQVLKGIQPPVPTYCCPVCGDCFYTQEELLDHMEAEHPEEPPLLASLHGTIVDAVTSAPLEGVKVVIDGLTTYTTSSGEYLFEDLSLIDYIVTFELGGYETASATISPTAGSNTLDAEMTLPPFSVAITGFHYVYQSAYNWILSGRMIHGFEITHIGFTFMNNGMSSIYPVTVKFRVMNGGTHELSVPLDQYLAQLSQPFTVENNAAQGIWYASSPTDWVEPGEGSLASAIAVAEVYVDGELVATSTMPFTISY